MLTLTSLDAPVVLRIFGGKQNTLNNLCNAMTDACAGVSNNEKKSRRITSQQALSILLMDN